MVELLSSALTGVVVVVLIIVALSLFNFVTAYQDMLAIPLSRWAELVARGSLAILFAFCAGAGAYTFAAARTAKSSPDLVTIGGKSYRLDILAKGALTTIALGAVLFLGLKFFLSRGVFLMLASLDFISAKEIITQTRVGLESRDILIALLSSCFGFWVGYMVWSDSGEKGDGS